MTAIDPDDADMVILADCPMCAETFKTLDTTGAFVLAAQLSLHLAETLAESANAPDDDDDGLDVYRNLLCQTHVDGFNRVLETVRSLIIREVMVLEVSAGSA